jgi:hypothetical protein
MLTDAGNRFRGSTPPMVKIWVTAFRKIVKRVIEIDERAICCSSKIVT